MSLKSETEKEKLLFVDRKEEELFQAFYMDQVIKMGQELQPIMDEIIEYAELLSTPVIGAENNEQTIRFEVTDSIRQKLRELERHHITFRDIYLNRYHIPVNFQYRGKKYYGSFKRYFRRKGRCFIQINDYYESPY